MPERDFPARAAASADLNLDGLLANYPTRATRKAGAEWVSRLFFPVSHRTLEAWPLTWRRVNGKAVVETAELFAVAKAKLESAPAIRGGRGPAGSAAR
jgi:hypothetical protein